MLYTIWHGIIVFNSYIFTATLWEQYYLVSFISRGHVSSFGDLSKVMELQPELPGLERARFQACTFISLCCAASEKGRPFWTLTPCFKNKSWFPREKIGIIYKKNVFFLLGADKRALSFWKELCPMIWEGNSLEGFSLSLEKWSHSLMEFSHTSLL